MRHRDLTHVCHLSLSVGPFWVSEGGTLTTAVPKNALDAPARILATKKTRQSRATISRMTAYSRQRIHPLPRSRAHETYDEHQSVQSVHGDPSTELVRNERGDGLESDLSDILEAGPERDVCGGKLKVAFGIRDGAELLDKAYTRSGSRSGGDKDRTYLG